MTAWCVVCPLVTVTARHAPAPLPSLGLARPCPVTLCPCLEYTFLPFLLPSLNCPPSPPAPSRFLVLDLSKSWSLSCFLPVSVAGVPPWSTPPHEPTYAQHRHAGAEGSSSHSGPLHTWAARQLASGLAWALPVDLMLRLPAATRERDRP